MAAAIAIFTLLFIWYKRGKRHGLLYAYYLAIYGVIRFLLNFMRDIPIVDEMPLPFGNIWSIVSIIIGTVWILISYYKKLNKEYKTLKKE